MAALPSDKVYRETDLNEFLSHRPCTKHRCNKLLDWWPSSQDLPSDHPRSDPLGPNIDPGLLPPPPATAASNRTADNQSSGRPYSAALRLSEVAAALKTLPRAKDNRAVPLHAPSIDPLSDKGVLPVVDLNDGLQGTARHLSSTRQMQSRPPKGPRQTGGKGSKSGQAGSNRQKRNMLALRQLQQKPITKDGDPVSRREIHIYSERQRRKGMTHLYSTLHSLLPHGKPKTDRCTVLTETMKYIQTLRKKLEELGRKRTEIIAAMGSVQKSIVPGVNKDPNVSSGEDGGTTEAETDPTQDRTTVDPAEGCRPLCDTAEIGVRFFDRDAFITLKTPKQKGLWSRILQVLHEQSVEVLNVTLSTSPESDFHCIHAKVPTSSELRSCNLRRFLQELVIVEPATESCELG